MAAAIPKPSYQGWCFFYTWCAFPLERDKQQSSSSSSINRALVWVWIAWIAHSSLADRIYCAHIQQRL